MAAGLNHSLAVTTDGFLYAWGRNQKGQLGDGTNADSATPVKISEVYSVTQVAAGQYHSLYITNHKTDNLYAMGWNQYGQLGDGTTTDRNSSVNIAEVYNVEHIAAGSFSSYYRTDSSGGVFGRNNYGQLGDETTIDRNASVTGSIIFQYATFAPGQYHAYMLDNDNSLLAWGRNNYGQLGNGTTTDSDSLSVVLGSNAMQPKWLSLTVTTNGSDGSVAVSGDFNTTTQLGIYNKGTEVSLTASFSSLGYVFTGWSGSLSGTALTPSVTMNDHKSITATFFAGYIGQRWGRADQLR
jgi:uncharacterized repeat protein (TIGR02543 family)